MQEVSERMLGLLSRQPWQSAYHRSPLPGGIGGIGRCCTMILLRKVCVGASCMTLPSCRRLWPGSMHAATSCCANARVRQPLADQFCCCCHAPQDRVGPPPGQSEVQWLEPYVCSLNDTRLDVGFQRDVKGVRCTILGRPVRIRWGGQGLAGVAGRPGMLGVSPCACAALEQGVHVLGC